MSTTFRVTITRKEGLSDPEGSTSRKALVDLGFDEVSDVSFGRIITITVDDDDHDRAAARVDEMCTKLLANPVMERYRVETVS
jgi:phosphoribosylformylglycinamidine synthase PurS subunit